MFGLEEAKATFDLMDKAQSWLTKVIESDRNQKKQAAAHVLAAAGVLVGALNIIVSGYKSVISPLRLFGLSWPINRRESAAETLNGYIMGDQLLPLIQQKISELDELKSILESDDRVFVETLVRYARQVGKKLNCDVLDDALSPMFDRQGQGLSKFLRSIHDAETSEEVDFIISATEESLKNIGSMPCSEARTGYGRLRARILTRFPDITPPDWDGNLSHTMVKIRKE